MNYFQGERSSAFIREKLTGEKLELLQANVTATRFYIMQACLEGYKPCKRKPVNEYNQPLRKQAWVFDGRSGDSLKRSGVAIATRNRDGHVRTTGIIPDIASDVHTAAYMITQIGLRLPSVDQEILTGGLGVTWSSQPHKVGYRVRERATCITR